MLILSVNKLSVLEKHTVYNYIDFYRFIDNTLILNKNIGYSFKY